MGYYGRSTSGIASLAKMLNGLIALILMALIGFMAIPSFLVKSKSMAQMKGGPYNNRILVNALKQKRGGKVPLTVAISPGAVLTGSGENNSIRLVKKIPPREENKDKESDPQE